MRVTRVDVRFFRSFNYDFELKSRPEREPEQWEDPTPAWFPFIRVGIEPDITAIVGANESGKSQLLLATTAALTGDPIRRSDFCRYSELYSVQEGEIRLPEFGVSIHLEDGEAITGIPELDSVKSFSLYRPGAADPYLVIADKRVPLTAKLGKELTSQLPSVHTLETDLALPENISIAQLTGRPRSPLHNRGRRMGLLSSLIGVTAEDKAGKVVVDALNVGTGEASEAAIRKADREFGLARQLLVDVAGVATSSFSDLEAALAAGREGEVEAIVGGINAAIRERLNVQRWWTQDRDFDLLVEAREQEIAFTIRDRTNSKYSFEERSQGLRFFLSYFVQLTAHRLNNTVPDVLLLDEPDAYLSSVGQQDLLRVLQEYSQPEGGGPRSQVIYVTHSPFLIDKNAPHRIRVLDKGSDDEGTRVVRDAANNRYEPLRSALGVYAAETAFIGGRNLFVEGAGDQVLLTGLAAHLVGRNGTTLGALDLNKVTVVAAGGADAIPYMVYLARGRDSFKPACVALLDGDKSGLLAEKVLQRGEARKKRILKNEYIVRLDLWAAKSGFTWPTSLIVEEIEDLLPLPLVHRAALNHLARFVDLRTVDTTIFTVDAIAANIQPGVGVWDSLEAAYVAAFPDEHIEKVGLAREVITLISLDPDTEGASELRDHFSSLLQALSDRLDDAYEEEERGRSDDRLKRTIRNFERDHKTGISKTDARRLLRDVTAALGDSDADDRLRAHISKLGRDFELDDFAVHDVPRFDEFRAEVKAFGSAQRIAFQDDAAVDPAAAVIEVPAPAPTTAITPKAPPASSVD
jgi:predicted ATPase